MLFDGFCRLKHLHVRSTSLALACSATIESITT
ncbi:hypothetical protein [Armatimonas sp.]